MGVQADKIKNDPKGQWAIQATSSSSYNDAQGQAQWSANQATGAPNVQNYVTMATLGLRKRLTPVLNS